MEVIHKGRSAAELFKLIQNGKTAGQAGHNQRTEVGLTVGSAKVNISRDAWKPQRIVQQLVRKFDERLAEKVRQLKERIAKGEYEINPRLVAKSIIRTEISGHLEKRKVQSMNIVLTTLLVLTDEAVAVGEKNGGAACRIKRSPSQRWTSSRFPYKSIQNRG